ncbi:BRCT domain-containing protein (plasmid) [Shewanella sp. HL-SH4]|uniref:BRCT domain-containing protein n=1 Tax=Shewanella TaxID=22 RepID=UPI003D79E59D
MKKLLKTTIANLSDVQLSDLMTYLNDQYRKGTPQISDTAFDFIYLPSLRQRVPQHPLITKVQPEPAMGSKGRIKHLHPMLSTDKAYLDSELSAYTYRCQQTADALQQSELKFRITAKLDGIAAKYDSILKTVVTRGDGSQGYEVGRLLELGLTVIGKGSGVGEMVISQAYFDEHLSNKYKHSRNFVAGIVNADNINADGLKALADGAIHLVLFKDMFGLTVSANEINTNMVQLAEWAGRECPYNCDGTVIEVINPVVKEAMGANDRFHNWQIAFKQQGETAQFNVLGVTWSVGRNKITPVIEVEPQLLSGAVISRVTAHHAGNVKSLSLGKGAVIELVRSGFIIPKIEKCIKTGLVEIPTHCPCCKEPVEWANDFILCINDACSERKVSSICYHFELIQCDLFGRKSVQKLVLGGLDSIEAIYQATQSDIERCGLGAGQATNLINELQRIRSTPVDDFKVLASLGIKSLGRGSSKRILKIKTLNEIATLSASDISILDNFGELTANIIATSLRRKADFITFLISQLNIRHTKSDTPKSGSLVGLKLVFTGKMESSRDQMKVLAENNGAEVQSSVRKDTTYLVKGQNVGATKINAAQSKGVTVIDENAFYAMIA